MARGGFCASDFIEHHTVVVVCSHHYHLPKNKKNLFFWEELKAMFDQGVIKDSHMVLVPKKNKSVCFCVFASEMSMQCLNLTHTQCHAFMNFLIV